MKTERENWILKYHMQPTHTPYLTKEWLQPKRYKAEPLMFMIFLNYFIKPLEYNGIVLHIIIQILNVLVMFYKLQEVERAPGTNLYGIVTWIFTLFTPEYHPKS